MKTKNIKVKSRERYLVTGIVTGTASVLPGFISILFLTLGIVFTLNPYGATINVNGTILQGEEAAAVALKYGRIFLGVGGGLFVLAVVLLTMCVVSLIKYFTKKSI